MKEGLEVLLLFAIELCHNSFNFTDTHTDTLTDTHSFLPKNYQGRRAPKQFCIIQLLNQSRLVVLHNMISTNKIHRVVMVGQNNIRQNGSKHSISFWKNSPLQSMRIISSFRELVCDYIFRCIFKHGSEEKEEAVSCRDFMEFLCISISIDLFVTELCYSSFSSYFSCIHEKVNVIKMSIISRMFRFRFFFSCSFSNRYIRTAAWHGA